jgi:hypothetical protein
MSSTKSADFSLPLQRLIAIGYKGPIAILFLWGLTLYPSPSPLFHIAFLPALILIHRHDPILFVSTSLCVGLVGFIADIGGGKEIIYATEHLFLVIGSLMASIVIHHRLCTLCVRSAWFDSLLFGSLWTGCGIITRTFNHVSLSG